MSATIAVSLGGFAILLLWAVALERAARRGAAAHALDAVTAAMRGWWGRLAVFAAWVWLGVHFLAR